MVPCFVGPNALGHSVPGGEETVPHPGRFAWPSGAASSRSRWDRRPSLCDEGSSNVRSGM